MGILHKTLPWQRSQEVLSVFQAAMLCWGWALWGFWSARPGAQHWLLNCYTVVLRQQKWLPWPSLWKDALEVKGGGGSGLCWLLWGRFSVTDLGLCTLSWAVHKCVGGISAVCLSLWSSLATVPLLSWSNEGPGAVSATLLKIISRLHPHDFPPPLQDKTEWGYPENGEERELKGCQVSLQSSSEGKQEASHP